MERRAAAVEWLDGPLDDQPELVGNLRDLARINRWLGGSSLSERAIDALLAGGHPDAGAANGQAIRLLDVGTGGADIPLALLARARTHARRLHIVGLDSRSEVLEAAILADPRLATEPDLTLELGDGQALPYPDDSFDLAHASLVLHHLTPGEAGILLAEMARVARRGVVINDLARGWLAWSGAWLLGHTLTTNRLTRHDGPISVTRAYRPSEASAMLARVGLRVVATEAGLFGHRWAIAAERIR
ncbi:MAG: methyltransferase domain-containing protein [Candidatus Limnocylindrales bacterium]